MAHAGERPVHLPLDGGRAPGMARYRFDIDLVLFEIARNATCSMAGSLGRGRRTPRAPPWSDGLKPMVIMTRHRLAS